MVHEHPLLELAHRLVSILANVSGSSQIIHLTFCPVSLQYGSIGVVINVYFYDEVMLMIHHPSI